MNKFFEELTEVNTHQIFDIVLVDFNISALKQNVQVLYVLTNYDQVFKESTQLSGGLLDHVFIRKDIAMDIDVQSIAIRTRLSDQDVVFLMLHMKNNEWYIIYLYIYAFYLYYLYFKYNIRHFY